MKNVILATSLFLAMVGFTAGTARAQSPHFIHTATVTGIDSSGEVTVSFKEAGVGNSTFVSYSFTADASADYGCINGGSKHPKAANKATSQGPVSSSGTFQSGKNGSISASLTLTPPPPPSGFSCPAGQTEVIADTSLTRIWSSRIQPTTFRPI